MISARLSSYRQGVIEVNPAYTSLIGKIKYLKRLRCPVHVAAAYVIGRRGMGFREKVPGIYKNVIPRGRRRAHHWKQYACLYKHLKDAPAGSFYAKLDTFNDAGQLKSLKPEKRYA